MPSSRGPSRPRDVTTVSCVSCHACSLPLALPGKPFLSPSPPTLRRPNSHAHQRRDDDDSFQQAGVSCWVEAQSESRMRRVEKGTKSELYLKKEGWVGLRIHTYIHTCIPWLYMKIGEINMVFLNKKTDQDCICIVGGDAERERWEYKMKN